MDELFEKLEKDIYEMDVWDIEYNYWLNHQDGWKEESKEKERVKILIAELKKEVDFDWARDRRLEYLEERVKKVYKLLSGLQRLEEKNPEMFLLTNELRDAERKYKHLYIEFATLNAYTEKKSNRHSDDVVQRCREVPIENLFDAHIHNAGNGRKRMCCPFHNERTGSFFIFPDNTWHCFGCGAHGHNTIDFIMKLKEINFQDAVTHLMSF